MFHYGAEDHRAQNQPHRIEHRTHAAPGHEVIQSCVTAAERETIEQGLPDSTEISQKDILRLASKPQYRRFLKNECE